jgi:hypothetical protein
MGGRWQVSLAGTFNFRACEPLGRIFSLSSLGLVARSSSCAGIPSTVFVRAVGSRRSRVATRMTGSRLPACPRWSVVPYQRVTDEVEIRLSAATVEVARAQLRVRRHHDGPGVHAGLAPQVRRGDRRLLGGGRCSVAVVVVGGGGGGRWSSRPDSSPRRFQLSRLQARSRQDRR